MSEKSRTSRLEKLAQWPGLALLVLVAGVTLTVFAFVAIRDLESARQTDFLEKRADEFHAMLAGRIREYHLTGWYLGEANKQIGLTNRRAFEDTARDLLKSFPELQAVEWTPRIRHEQRADFVRRAREVGMLDYRITEPGAAGMIPAADREEYCAICFVVPLEGNESAVGLDVYMAASSSAVTRCRDSGEVQLSGPIRLVQEKGDQMGVVLYVPYYDEELLGETPGIEDRRKAFQGVFQLVFRSGDMLSKLLDTGIVTQTEQLPKEIASETNTVAAAAGNVQDLFEGMDLLVEDLGAEQSTLFFRAAPIREGGSTISEEEFLKSDAASRSIAFGGRHWRVQLGAAPEFMKSQRTFNAQGTAMSGLAFTVLMLSYVLMLQRKAREVDELVEIRTGELERSFGQLEQRQERLSSVNVTMAELSRLETAGEAGLEQYLRKICEAVAERFDIDRVGVWLFSPKRDDLRCECMYMLRNQRWTKGRVLTAGEFPGYFDALDAGQQINAVNARLDRRTGGMSEDYLEPENIFSMFNAPIRRGGQMVGVVSYEALGKHRRWSQEESTLGGAVADFVTLALTDDERSAAEARLRESERLYHSLVENLPQFVFRKDLEGKFTFANEQLCEGFGKEESEILGFTDDDLCPPELAKKYRADDRCVIEKGEILEFVEECQLVTGRFFLHTCKTPIRDDNGEIVGIQGIAWDITERYRLQDALNASDERFRGLVDSLDCIVWEANPDDMSFTFVSRQAERMLGYPLGMWIDDVEFWTNRIHVEDREWVIKACREAIAEGTGREFEYRMLATEERIVWVRNILSLEKDGDGKVTRVRGLMIDTTERRQMQGELQQSTERMRLFIQHTPTSVAMFDTRMRYILASRRWYEDNGLAEREIIGRSHYDVVPDIPDRWRRIHEHCLLGNSAECEEDIFIREDGSTEFVRWEIHPWHKGADVGGVIMFAEIITDRVNARIAIERSEAILQATGRAAELFLKAQTWSDALVEVMEHLGDATRAGRIWFLQNERGAKDSLIGRLRLEWFSDQGAQEIAVANANRFDWDDPAIERWRDVLAAGGVAQGHLREFRKEEVEFIGGEPLKSILVVPLRVRGEWWGVIGFDVYEEEREWNKAEIGALKGAADNLCAAVERELAESERINLERKMQDSQRLESLGVLAGGIAHDFNNLLTAIIGNAGLIRLDAEKESPLLEPIGVIEKTALRAADLCKQMLAYAGKGRFEMVTLDLNELVEDTADLLKVSISKKSKLELVLEDELPRVQGDAAQLQQIIMNLVINASEAIGDHPGEIHVSTAIGKLGDGDLSRDDIIKGEAVTAGEYICLTVKDSGPGIPEESLDRIFEPFYSTKFTGRGLGLAAVQGIVKGHGGAMIVSSGAVGATFELYLPAAELIEEKPRQKEGPADEIPAGRRILLVDDEDEVRNVAQSLLRKWGVDVTTATNGREGLDQFAKNGGEFDLVLMDYLMPQMNGVEAAVAMRRIRGDVKILMMSGFDEQNSVEKYEDVGVSGFLQKPFKWELFKHTVSGLLLGNGNGSPKE